MEQSINWVGKRGHLSHLLSINLSTTQAPRKCNTVAFGLPTTHGWALLSFGTPGSLLYPPFALLWHSGFWPSVSCLSPHDSIWARNSATSGPLLRISRLCHGCRPCDQHTMQPPLRSSGWPRTCPYLLAPPLLPLWESLFSLYACPQRSPDNFHFC